MQRSNDAVEVRGSFQETAQKDRRKHRDGSVGLVVANHHGGSGSSLVVTTLISSHY